MTALQETDIDRLSELANIGAGHAAGAFAQLTGRSIKMKVPRIRLSGLPIDVRQGEIVIGEATPSGWEDRDWTTGVIFEFDGCLNAVVGNPWRIGHTVHNRRCGLDWLDGGRVGRKWR